MKCTRLCLFGILFMVLSASCLMAVQPPPPPPPAMALPPINAEVKFVGPFSYIAIECGGPYTQFAAAEKAFLREFKASGIKPSGKEFALYWNSPLYVKPELLKWDIGYQVSSETKSMGRMLVKKFPYNKVASAMHSGSYLTTYKTINALYAWIAATGLKTVGGPCVEVYLDDDPDKVPDKMKRTDILIPVM